MSLSSEFINNSADFWNDIDLKNIDGKHGAILQEVHQLNVDDPALASRNWAQQSDMVAVAQFNLSLGLKYGFLRTLYRKTYCRAEERAIKSMIFDDIAVLESVGAGELLKSNPVHLTPGVGYYSLNNGYSVNQRWLRYIYLTNQILKKGLLNKGAWVDIGSYYGGVQGIVHKYNPEAPKILVDFHHQLLKSFVYLKTLYPNALHIFPDQIGKQLLINELPHGAFVYCPISKFGSIGSVGVDLITNFFSFGEMSRKTFFEYFDSEIMSCAKNQYFVNRFVSAPFFEPTYDSDLTIVDYLNSREVRYFDVFPMHHYHLIKRPVLGRTAFRNTSSSYFELIR
jgi:putative sugar O-methyltransferase